MLRIVLFSILCVSFLIVVADGRKMPRWHRPRWQCHESNGRFQDEDDCTKYYFCQNYEWAHYGCPDGLHFNEERNKCESPETAGCDKRYSTSTQKP